MKHLRILLASLALIVGGGSLRAQQEPVNGTSYYVYNVETGKFLTRGNTWGTQAVTNEVGSPWQVSVSDGKYTLRMLDIVTGNSTNGLGDNGYSDNGSPIAWTVSGNTSGYKLSNGSTYLTSPATYGDNVIGSDANGNTTWQFLNVDEYKAVLAAKISAQESAVAESATVTLGESTLSDIVANSDVFQSVDKTSSVNAATPNKTNWTISSVGNRAGVVNEGTYGVEIYEGGGSFSQSVTGLQKGIYKVGVKAMLRSASNAICYSVGQAGYVNSSAYIQVNGNVAQIKDWYSSCASDSDPNTTARFVEIANGGGYYSEVFAYVGDDGKLDIKVCSESYWGASWFLFGGVTLTYYENVLEKAVNQYKTVRDRMLTVISGEGYTDAETKAETAFKNTITEQDAVVDAATSFTAVNAAIEAVRNAAGTFLGAVEVTGTVDATALIMNDTPTANADFWTVSGNPTFDTGNNNAEFWNQSGASIKQQLYNLPTGYYVLTAVALAREGHVGTLSAGENSMNLVTVASDPVNSRSQANTWFNAGNGVNALSFHLTDAGNVEIGITSDNANGDHWTVWRNFKLEFFGTDPLAAPKAAYEQALALAKEVKNGESYKNVTGTEAAALAEALETYGEVVADYDNVDTSKTELETAASALNAAAKAVQDAAPSYDEYVAEVAKAEVFDLSVDVPTTAAEAVTATQNLKVAEYNYVTENYTTAIELGEWTQEGGTALNYGGQHWSGENRGYWEQTSANYSASSWSISFNQTIELPAGDYLFKVAGRHASEVTMSLDVTSGETTLGTVKDFPTGDTGKGIDTSGATNFSADGTYAYNNNGRGWEWRYVPFTLTETTSVNIAVNASATAQYKWISFCDYTVQAKPNVEASKVVLQQAIEAAESVIPTNVGENPFQYKTADIDTFKAAIETAKAAKDAEDATIESIEAAVEALQTAVEALDDLELTEPADGQRYYLKVATEGHAKNGNAVVVNLGGTSANNPTGYGFNASAEPAVYLAQAYFFTKVEDKANTYNIAVERPEGIVYLTYGAKNESAAGWKDSQIQGTTTESAKGEFKIVADAMTENVFNIVNTITNTTIACQSGGALYTENGNADFTVEAAEKASVDVKISAAVQYATRIFPFVPTLPEGIVAYTCSELSGSDLTLVEVTSLEANKPYILFAENGYTGDALAGWGTATADNYTEGLLTGVYVAKQAEEGSYVLQNHDGKVSFYKVVDTKPTVGAYRAYLTKADTESKTLGFGGDATSIDAIDALTSGSAVIYNASGVQIQSLQKGMNIVKMNDGSIRKIMVK